MDDQCDLFEPDKSDSDVSITSTAPSEPRSEYAVDRILAEQSNDDNVPIYLLKWSGYPLWRSSWEEADNLCSDSLLEQWEKRKRDEEEGRETPFDLENFFTLVEDLHSRGERRKAKRAAKRKALERERKTRKKSKRLVPRKELPQVSQPANKSIDSPKTNDTPTNLASRLAEPEIASGISPKPGLAASSRPNKDYISSDSDSDPEEPARLVESIGNDGSDHNSTSFSSTPILKRQRSSSPARRQRTKRTKTTTQESALSKRNRAAAQLSGNSPRDSPLPPPSPVVATCGSQGSFNSLFDSTQDEAAAKPPTDPIVKSISPSTTSREAAAKALLPTGVTALKLAKEQASGQSRHVPHATSTKVLPEKSKSLSNIHPLHSSGVGSKATADDSTPTNARTVASIPPSPKDLSGSLATVTEQPTVTATVEAAKAAQSNAPGTSIVAQAVEIARKRPTTSVSSREAPLPLPIQPIASMNSTTASTDMTSKPQVNVVAAAGTAKRSGPSIFKNWTEPKKRSARGKLDPKNNTTPGANQFRNLRQQNNIQKWANSEQAPDPNSLRDLNVQTGRLEELQLPNQSTDKEQPSTTIGKHTYGLRIDTDATSYSKDSTSARPASLSAHDPSVSSGSHVLQNASSHPPNRAAYGRKDITCSFWLKGLCRVSSDGCAYAHVDTGRYKAKTERCKWWPRCRFSDDECMFLHGKDGTWRSLEERTGRGSYFGKQKEQREESPDTSGLRQDQLDELREARKLNALTHITIRSDLTAVDKGSAPHVRGPANTHEINHHQDQQLGLLGQVHSPELTTGATDGNSHSDIHSDTGGDYVASPDSIDASPIAIPREISAVLHMASSDENATTVLPVKLLVDSHPRHNDFVDLLGENAELHAESICLVKDFQQYCHDDNQMWTSGVVLPEGSMDTYSQLAEFLMMNAAGAIVQQNQFLMVIYPKDTPGNEWDFLQSKTKSKINSAIQFHVQSASASVYETLPQRQQVQDASILSTLCREELELDKSRMFQGNNHKRLDKTVFVMFPSREVPEVQLIVAWLVDIRATIYFYDEPGAWTLFKSNARDLTRSGVILLHPSMTRYWQMPDLNHMLFSGQYNIFLLGSDRTLTHHQEAATKYSCVRLFPFGGATLITDDVLEHHPKLAVNVLGLFCSGLATKPKGAKFDRILTRPGIKDWLLDLMQKYSRIEDQEDLAHRGELYKMVSKLLDNADDGGTYPFANAEPPMLISPSVKDMPEHAKLWDEDEVEATDRLVQWFAGWCMLERERFRRFVVVHEQSKKPEQTPGHGSEKDPREWSKKYNHIKVMNAERWRLSGGGKK